MNSLRHFFGCILASMAVLASVAGAEAPLHWGPDQFTPLTAERIAQLPAKERAAWQNYWDASQKLAAKIPVDPKPEFSPMQPIDAPPRGGAHTKGLRLDAPDEWYASDEARTVADRVVAAQTAAGAWTKGNDYTKSASAAAGEGGVWARGTFDNDATIYEMRFLARVQQAAAKTASTAALEAWRASFLRGLEYVFAAQYPNGGFPQVYPLVGGYHDGVTYNDDAMVHALELLRDIAGGHNGELDFAHGRAAEAEKRLALGTQCILATQLRGANGQLTVWCQQHDPLTLKPAAARNFEPIADVSNESVKIVEFLMSQRYSPEVTASVEGAVAWFRAAALHDVVWIREPGANRGEVIARPGAPLLWARFYLPGTMKPIFGDRDRTIHFSVAEISAERRAGYAWYGTWPAGMLEKYPTWRNSVKAR